jgi:hypothetical protein
MPEIINNETLSGNFERNTARSRKWRFFCPTNLFEFRNNNHFSLTHLTHALNFLLVINSINLLTLMFYFEGKV